MIEQIQLLLSASVSILTQNWPSFIYGGVAYLMIHELGKLTWHEYLHNINHKHIHGLKFKVFQLRFPKENLKSPKAMEQVVASMHGTYSFGINWRKKYILGEVEDWFSLEMVGRSNGITFYAWIKETHEEFFRSAFFAQYPEVEIVEVEDYMNQLPEKLPNETYTLFAADYVFDKPDPYPIRTYEFFDSPDEDQRLDPMSTLAEAVSSLKADEIILIQIIFRPTGKGEHPTLQSSYDSIIESITGKKKEKKHGGLGITTALKDFAKNIIFGAFSEPKWTAEHAEEEKQMMFRLLAPGEQETLAAVDNKMSKNLFEVIFRFIYIDRKDSFTSSNVRAVFGAVTQFSERNMNALRPWSGTTIFAEYLPFIKGSPKRFNKKSRLDKKRRKIYKLCRARAMPLGHTRWFDLEMKTNVMSSEEIATIFHPPGMPVGAQKLAPLETKKVAPPRDLPILD